MNAMEKERLELVFMTAIAAATDAGRARRLVRLSVGLTAVSVVSMFATLWLSH